jgi:hypothetical protein
MKKPYQFNAKHAHLTAAIIIALSVLISAQPLSVDLISTGVGSWVSMSAGGSEQRATYFTKLPASIYFSFLGFKAYAGVPLLWTVQTQDGMLNDQLVRIADINVYIGRRLSIFEPRFGAKFPTGYRTDRVWIGTRNVRLQAGLALNSTVRETESISISSEAMFNLYLPGSKAKAHWKSWELLPSFKTSIRTTETFRLGLEILAFLKNVYWSRDYEELSAGAVPNIYAEFRLSQSVYISPKIGFGPTYKKAPGEPRLYHRGNSVNVNLALNIYP